MAVDYDFYQSALGYLKELTNTGMNYIFFGFDNYMKNHNRTKHMVADIKDDLIETLSECSEKEINYAPLFRQTKNGLDYYETRTRTGAVRSRQASCGRVGARVALLVSGSYPVFNITRPPPNTVST